MATVSFTRYHADDPKAAGRTNEYIVDGHGTAAPERTNRYIVSPEKHGETPSAAHNCPNDPQAATEYMETLRANYERLHGHRKVLSGESARKDITHVMFYLSWAEHEDVPDDEALQMTQELIDRTELKNYPIFYAVHNNTFDPDNEVSPGNKHTHLSCCPYALDGSRKLSITDRLKHDIWREADRICVEHGYSIIHTPVLLADPEYRRWFDEVVENGETTIWKSQPKGDRRKYEEKIRYREAKDKERDIEKMLEAEIDLRIRKGEPEDVYFLPGVMEPARPGKQLTLSRLDPHTKEERSDLQCECLFFVSWATQMQKQVDQFGPAGKKVAGKIDKALQNAKVAYRTITGLDIRNRTELQQHINDVGCDLAELRKDIKRQHTILSQMAPLLGLIEEWEGKHTPEAYNGLKRLKCASNDGIEDAKRRVARARARLKKNEELLAARKKEYAQLCKARTAVERCTSPEAWNEYMHDLAELSAKTIGSRGASYDEIIYTVHSIGSMFGLSNDDVDAKVRLALEQPQSARNEIYRNIAEMKRIREELYQYNQRRKEDLWNEMQRQREIRKRFEMLGIVGLILFLLFMPDTENELQRQLSEIRYAQAAAKDLKTEMDIIARETITSRKMLDAGMTSEDLQDRIETVEEYTRVMRNLDRHIDRCFFLAAAAGVPFDIPRVNIDRQIQEARDRGYSIRNKQSEQKRDRP